MSSALARPVPDHLKHLPRPMLWALAARLKTLSLSAAPVLAGSLLAAQQGRWRGDVLAAALVASAAIQIATNLWNDAADAERGTDDEHRLGPPRMTANGLLEAPAVRRGALAMGGIAGLAGLWLVLVGGPAILILGLVSLALGYLYSMGPRPLSATPLGGGQVIGFFGIAAVAGTAFLHGGSLSPGLFAQGFFLGLPAAAVLLVNNHRDRSTDARAGRRTLAIVLGEGASRLLYGTFMLAATAGLAVLARPCAAGWAVFAALALVAGGLSWRMAQLAISPALNRLLAQTALFQMALVAGLALTRALCG